MNILILCIFQTYTNGEKSYERIFGKHTPIPSRIQRTLQLGEGQTAACVHVLMAAADNSHTSLAKVCRLHYITRHPIGEAP